MNNVKTIIMEEAAANLESEWLDMEWVEGGD